MGFLTKCPISVENKLGGLLETGRSVLQAFNTSTSLEFMARLVCRSWGERVGMLGVKQGGRGVAL